MKPKNNIKSNLLFPEKSGKRIIEESMMLVLYYEGGHIRTLDCGSIEEMRKWLEANKFMPTNNNVWVRPNRTRISVQGQVIICNRVFAYPTKPINPIEVMFLD